MELKKVIGSKVQLKLQTDILYRLGTVLILDFSLQVNARVPHLALSGEIAHIMIGDKIPNHKGFMQMTIHWWTFEPLDGQAGVTYMMFFKSGIR